MRTARSVSLGMLEHRPLAEAFCSVAHLGFIDLVEDFERQLAPTFRYRYLPPILGEGPVQARRWHDLLRSIYRTWRYEAEDGHDADGVVALRVTFYAEDPPEPEHTAPRFEDSVLFQFEIENGRLAGCDAAYLPFEEHQRRSA